MMTATLITILAKITAALNPTERWRAAGDFAEGGFITQRWLIITVVVILMILAGLLIVVSLKNRSSGQRTSKNRSFDDYADKRGLSRRERQILLYVANEAQLKETESIFALKDAFDRGSAVVIKKGLESGRAAEQNEQFRTELSYLSEKLGFGKPVASASSLSARTLSSRQIEVGKKLYITRRTNRKEDDIETTVMKNDDAELTVELTKPVSIVFGQVWRARYYFGTSVWEFDTSVISCTGNVLVLNHSDNVRFINRRRFLRVKVNRPALMAAFPFIQATPDPTTGAEIISPVRISHLARPLPTNRGSRCVPPNPGMSPRLISGCPSLAESAAMRMSQAITNSQPPPSA